MLTYTIFGSAVGFLVALVVLIIASLAFEANEEGGWVAFFVIIFCGLMFFWGDRTFFKDVFSLRNILSYLVLGFIFSLIRTYFKGKTLSDDDKRYYNLKLAICRWWFLFPISLITWVCGDLLKDLFNALYRKIGHVYERIFGMPPKT